MIVIGGHCIRLAVSGKMLSTNYGFFCTYLFFFQNLFLPFLSSPFHIDFVQIRFNGYNSPDWTPGFLF
jgi:hypothetical protein